MTQRQAERTDNYQENPLWFHRWCPLIILCLILGKLCAFLEASLRCHGTARRFAVSPSRVSKGLRSYQETSQYTKSGGGGNIRATAQQRKVLPEPGRFPPADSSCACFCSESGWGVGLASLGKTSVLPSTEQLGEHLPDNTGLGWNILHLSQNCRDCC